MNEAPVVEAATFSVAEDQAAIGSVSATDPEDDALSYAIIDGDPDALFEFDVDGNLKVASGQSLDYETSQQHVLQVTATDGGGLSDTAEMIVNVVDVNEAPTPTSDTATTDEDNAVAIDVLANDTDPDGNALTITEVDGQAIVENGPTVTLTSGAEVKLVSGQLVYDPTTSTPLQDLGEGDVATDAFSYTVADDGGKTATSGVELTITGASDGIALQASYDIADIISGATDDLSGFVINGIDGDVDGISSTGDNSGWSVTAAGDINNDGFDDIIIGAKFADPNASNAGETYVVFGSPSRAGQVLELADLDGKTGFTLEGVALDDSSGYSVSTAGDFNNDGFDDFIIGAPFADPSAKDAGATYVVFGSNDFGTGAGFGATVELANLSGDNGFVIAGFSENSQSGLSVSDAGDINGDGIDDLIIGAPAGVLGGVGESFVVFGSSSGFDASLSVADLNGSNGFKLTGATDNGTGASVSSAGDLNNDGVDDLIIGAYRANNFTGESYVVFGSQTEFDPNVDLSNLDGTNGFVINGVHARGLSGISVSEAGDVNGDGIDDVIIGARHADANGKSSGEAYVVFGSSEGFGASLDLSSLDGTNGFSLQGVDVLDNSGGSVSAAGDINGDGLDDIIIGAASADPNGLDRESQGESYVVFGSESFEASLALADLDGTNGFALTGIDPFDFSGTSVSGAGDLNNDGFDDLVIGARGADPNGEFSGETYVIYGGDFISGSSQSDTASVLDTTDTLNLEPNQETTDILPVPDGFDLM